MVKTIEYEVSTSFLKDLKQLKKRFKTLDDDIAVAKKNAIELLHIKKIDNNSIELIPGLNSEVIKIYKIRKFACKALKGRGSQSGIRIIYAYDSRRQVVSLLEIYHKSDQVSESKARITQFLKNITK
ncbi:MAG: hypothetical protein KIT27_09760 [Legionellales bacterium]|nr:hypothetical protein [Legionellales bacterium]